jgi:hypothetical protein
MITFFLWWRPSWIPIDKKKIVWDHAKLIMYVFGSLKFMVSIKFFFISPYKNVGRWSRFSKLIEFVNLKYERRLQTQIHNV